MARGPVSWLGCSAAALPDGEVPSVGGVQPPQHQRILTVAGAAPASHRLPDHPGALCWGHPTQCVV